MLYSQGALVCCIDDMVITCLGWRTIRERTEQLGTGVSCIE